MGLALGERPCDCQWVSVGSEIPPTAVLPDQDWGGEVCAAWLPSCSTAQILGCTPAGIHGFRVAQMSLSCVGPYAVQMLPSYGSFGDGVARAPLVVGYRAGIRLQRPHHRRWALERSRHACGHRAHPGDKERGVVWRRACFDPTPSCPYGHCACDYRICEQLRYCVAHWQMKQRRARPHKGAWK